MQIGSALVVIAVAFFLFFAGYLRKVLRAAEGENGMLSAMVLAGATVMAVGAAIDATISFALADAADKIEPTAVQALQALWDNDFFPLALGSGVFLLASGLSIALHGALPRWLGWIAIVLGVDQLYAGRLRRLPRRRSLDPDRERDADHAGSGAYSASSARRARYSGTRSLNPFSSQRPARDHE